ncbi:MAG: Trp family transcriptional regulator [Spirochaetaceae bacterium]
MEKNNHWDENRPLAELSRALAICKDEELMEEFLGSLFTPAEVKEMGKRWALVRLLREEMSQRKIAGELGLSLCKITRGSKELKRENSPFRRIIELYEENFE